MYVHRHCVLALDDALKLAVHVTQGYVLLVRQQDKPGIIAAVSAILGRESVNISFMTVRA